MASDAAFYEVLENDLRALSAEARKTDSLATQITGWLQHTDYPQIKESAERAVLKLRAVAHEGRGVEAVRTPVRRVCAALYCMCGDTARICALVGSRRGGPREAAATAANAPGLLEGGGTQNTCGYL